LRSMLKRMNIEFIEDKVFWQFKDINVKWSELGFDDKSEENGTKKQDADLVADK